MSIRTLIGEVLQYLTKWRDNMVQKSKTGLRSDSVHCRACGGEVVEVNVNGNRACFRCGKKAPSK